jgi:UDP-N-acetylmuramoyl-L-alanyl-D-glutamate--2,6-diaminopimelate ligase
VTSFSLQRIVASLKERGLYVSSEGTLPDSIRAITDDTRRLSNGDLFVAVKGSAADGHRYLPQAKERGASVAIVETPGFTELPHVLVKDSRAAAAVAAATFYLFPARQLRIAGVTGTNGKTTTVNILRHLLHKGEGKAASMGTLGIVVEGSAGVAAASVPGDVPSAALTTPGPIELQRTLRSLVSEGVVALAMEVSSHSLDQHRVDGIDFDVAVFTNLSRDHIDYHGNMGAYFAAKARFVDLVAPDGTMVVNADDTQWLRLPRRDGRLIRFGIEDRSADVRVSHIKYSAAGSDWTLHIGMDEQRVRLPLIGAFNVSNALAAAAAAWAMDVPAPEIAALLTTAPQVTGRMERLHDNPVVLRDYAHTPDALERALLAVRPFAPGGVTVVFGCGGDRDRGKRPQMGSVALRLADRVIITSDNPRTEDPEKILDDIAAGMPGGAFERIEDRREAIQHALAQATRDGHLVLLAGKGHETYQIRGTERLRFDEKEIVEELVKGTGASLGREPEVEAARVLPVREDAG